MNCNRGYDQGCQTFWIIIVVAAILIWINYCMNDNCCGNICGGNCGNICGSNCGNNCCNPCF